MGALCSCPCRPSRSTRARDPAHESHVRLSLWAICRKPTYEVPPPTPELSAKNHEESVFSGVESPERHRDDDDDDDDDEREHWVSPRGEERLRLQRRARWDKISSTRAAASSPRSSSAGSSVLSPAGVRPLARLTGVENGADRTPPTIASSQGDVGFTRSVAGECRAPEPSDPPDPCSNLFKLNNFSNQTQAPTARLFPPASGTLAACGATGRRPPPPEAHPPPHAADAPPPSSSRTTPHSPSSTGRKRKTPGTSTFGCRASSSPRMSHRAWVWAGGCP